MIISIPTRVKIFNWLFNIYQGHIHFNSAILWTPSFVVTFSVGGITGVLLAMSAANFVLQNSLFLIAHLHNVIIVGVVFCCFAGLTYWFLKAFGCTLNAKWGIRGFWLWLICFLVVFIPLYVFGLMGMTRRLGQNINPQFHPLLMVEAGGAVLIVFGMLCQLIQIIISIRDREKNRDLTGDQWRRRTLNWATSLPAAFYNFLVVPEIQSRDACFHMKEKGEAYQRPEQYAEIHMPKNSPAGIIIADFSVIFGFAMIWYIWWLAIVVVIGGMTATWIAKSFDQDADYYVPVSDMEGIDNEHYVHLSKTGFNHVN